MTNPEIEAAKKDILRASDRVALVAFFAGVCVGALTILLLRG